MKNIIPRWIAGCVGLGVACLLAPPIWAQSFTVNSTGDAPDLSAGDGVCDAGGGVCTLRAAIQEANALPGLDTIVFNILGAGPHTIQPMSPLPNISDPVVIDGTSQPGYAGSPIIEFDGSMAGPAVGLQIVAGSSTVRGLVVNRFTFGIYLVTNGGNVVEGNFIGTDVTGTTALGNVDGIQIGFGSSNNRVGGTAASARNVISGNSSDGIQIFTGASSNVVEGNFIGTDVTGLLPLGNAQNGVLLLDVTNNRVGGVSVGARNIISANGGGIQIRGLGATGNPVEGNFIGLDVTGTLGLGNSAAGILISGAPGNIIGGTTAGAGNVLSANGKQGVLIVFDDSVGNRVEGNLIGTQADGTSPLGNTLAGVHVSGIGNMIGGAASGAGNTIAFNLGPGGVDIRGSANAIVGNTIRDNIQDGVFLFHTGGSGNSILGNAIYSNGDLGIDLGFAGVTANDPGDGDTGSNDLQNYPLLTATTGASVSGNLDSAPGTTFTLEFFANTACDPSGFGEGRTLVGSTAVATDGLGQAGFVAVPLSPAVAPGQFITATATDPVGSTSEFALCLEVPVVSDSDGDGLSDDVEITLGTDPLDPDTDDDGLLDGTEVDLAAGTGCPDPLNPDSDGDNLLDGDEVDGIPELTDPCSFDTDGDSIPDDIDPLPTDPTGTEGVIASDLRALCDSISALDLSIFLAPNNNAAKGRRNAMCNKLNAAANAVTEGDIADAISQLQSLRQKIDEAPNPKDWMVAGTPEIEFVVAWIDGNILLLGYL